MAARAYLAGSDPAGAGLDSRSRFFPATKSAARVAFNQIHKPSGKRIRYEKVVPGIGPVEAEDIVKGYEVEKGKYVLIHPDEINDVKLESQKHTMDLHPVPRRGRHRCDLLREAVFRRFAGRG